MACEPGCIILEGHKPPCVTPISKDESPFTRLVDRAVAGYATKDSGERAEFSSGMVRDTEKGKPRFSLLIPKGVPYEAQFLTRFAALMARGAEKYEARNWEKAEGEAELERYHSSAFRHLIQWIAGETDEDHAAAVAFNLLAAETVKAKLHQ